MFNKVSLLREEIILGCAFIVIFLPYFFFVKKIVMVRIDNLFKQLSYYALLKQRKIPVHTFFCLINLYFLFWHSITIKVFASHPFLCRLKNISLSVYTVITFVLLINSTANVIESLYRLNKSHLLIIPIKI